jgi:hypothetical protein
MTFDLKIDQLSWWQRNQFRPKDLQLSVALPQLASLYGRGLDPFPGDPAVVFTVAYVRGAIVSWKAFS